MESHFPQSKAASGAGTSPAEDEDDEDDEEDEDDENDEDDDDDDEDDEDDEDGDVDEEDDPDGDEDVIVVFRIAISDLSLVRTSSLRWSFPRMTRRSFAASLRVSISRNSHFIISLAAVSSAVNVEVIE